MSNRLAYAAEWDAELRMVIRDDGSRYDPFEGLDDAARIAPVEVDRRGVLRFVANPIIWFFINWHHSQGLNELAIAHQNGVGTEEQYRQFYRDMGYSVCGYGEIFGLKEN